jgi:hypothetical protein
MIIYTTRASSRELARQVHRLPTEFSRSNDYEWKIEIEGSNKNKK